MIQTTNTSQQTVALNGIISLGSVLRRFGCNCRLNGNAIEIEGEGYYEIEATVSVASTEAGAVTVAIYENGLVIPSAIAYGTIATAGDVITLPLTTTVRQNCCCNGASSITVVLLEGAGTVQNVSVRVTKA